MRFLAPVSVFPPGSASSAPPPEDYLEYLLSQEEHGATFADQTDTTVGGLPATLLTATVEEPLEGDRLTLTRDESLGISPTPWVMGPWTRS